VNAGKKISWVSWKSICQPKREGGLGVIDVRVVNVSLLAKWRWRLLGGGEFLWKDVLREKYGFEVGNLVVFPATFNLRLSYLWWKAIVKLEDGLGERWFSSEVVREVGNEETTSFWNVAWRGGVSFQDKYPRLFSISIQQGASLREMGGNGDWVFEWRRHFFHWEEQLLVLLNEELGGFGWPRGRRIGGVGNLWRMGSSQ
jgi:hypothetical protein